MSKISITNLKKTIYYLKRNGLRDTYLAALERFREKGSVECPAYRELTEEEKQRQRVTVWQRGPLFSILVPTYKTPPVYLRAMIDSVLDQTYENLELILADASGDDSVKGVVDTYEDERIVYIALTQNGGISENTNAALERARGEYVGLLDHDDLLIPDALYEMARQIEAAHQAGIRAGLLYSDEDKCDETGSKFYEGHSKMDFNLDLLLSNNYICHFLVLDRELAQSVGLRKDFDGAQDFDLVLRCAARLMQERERIFHIPKVLYHWRCHQASTAANPKSKLYAYEAGGRAVTSFLDTMDWKAAVVPLKHLGFYRVDYSETLFEDRKDLGAVGGPLWNHKKEMTGGIYDEAGNCPYQGLRKGFSGYMHRAVLQQEAYAVDVRKLVLRPQLWEVYEQVTGIPYLQRRQHRAGIQAAEDVCRKQSLSLAKEIHEKGYRILWDPEFEDEGNSCYSKL